MVQCMVVPQKTKQIELPHDPEIPLPRYTAKRIEIKRTDICIAMFISLFTITSRRTQLKCPLMVGWLN